MHDGQWVPIGSLVMGDRVLAFDEGAPNRYMREATVEKVWRTQKQTIEIKTESGTTVVCSTNHKWLLDSARGGTWREAKDLKLGDEIRTAGNPGAPNPSSSEYLAGYIAGATAGDGTFRFGDHVPVGKQVYWRVAVLTTDRPILDRLVTGLALFGVNVEVHPFSGGPGKPMSRVETRSAANLKVIADILATEQDSLAWKCGWLAGFLDTDGSASGSSQATGVIHRWSQLATRNDYLERTERYLQDVGFRGVRERSHSQKADSVRLLCANIADRVRFVSTVQPALHRKGIERVYGSRFPRTTDRVVALSYGPVQELVDITTSTRTFVAEGLATHNCYAATLAKRWGHDDLWHRSGPRRFMGENYWQGPARWNRTAERAGQPELVFCSSISDVFEAHPNPVVAARQDAARARLWTVAEQTPWLTWLLLTKRPGNIMGMVPWTAADWPVNVWAGTSVESQRWAETRIADLAVVPAPVRFLSCEPLVGPLHLESALADGLVNWVIAGGESGRRPAPMHPDWPRSLRDQSAAAGVPFHFKQWGSWAPRGRGEWAVDDEWTHPARHRWVDPVTGKARPFGEPTGLEDPAPVHMCRMSKKAAGRVLDGVTHDAHPSLAIPVAA
jgi:protein gp37